MTETVTEEYPATVKWVKYVLYIIPHDLGHTLEEVKVPEFDQDKALAYAPIEAAAFVFCRRLEFDAEIEEGKAHVVGEQRVVNDQFFFINIGKVVKRDQISQWWRTDYWHGVRRAMNRRGSHYAVVWPHSSVQRGFYFGYKPDVDVLLTH